MSLKRLAVKYIRDKAKGAYVKDTECAICSSEEELQLHHFNSLTPLWELWLRKNKIRILNEKDVLDNREQFIADNNAQLYDEVVTLCKSCHMDKLHKLFGKCPNLPTAKAQAKWVLKMRAKHDNLIVK